MLLEVSGLCSQLGVPLQTAFHKILHISCCSLRNVLLWVVGWQPGGLVVGNNEYGLLGRYVLVGQLTRDEFVCRDTEGPYVTLLVEEGVLDSFGRQPIWQANEVTLGLEEGVGEELVR